MNDQPRTGNGYSESEATKDDIELDMRLKAFQRDFDQIPSNSSVKDIIRKPFRRGKR